MTVPFGILSQVIHPGGRRLPSEEGLFPSSKHQAKYITRPFGGGYRPTIVHPTTVTQPGLTEIHVWGNLENADYREFVGISAKVTNYAKCRGCETICTTSAERAAHRVSCRTLILSSIRLLLKDAKCAICNSSTIHRTWNVPLCSDNCRIAWRFTIPAAFKAARELALRQIPPSIIIVPGKG